LLPAEQLSFLLQSIPFIRIFRFQPIFSFIRRLSFQQPLRFRFRVNVNANSPALVSLLSLTLIPNYSSDQPSTSHPNSCNRLRSCPMFRSYPVSGLCQLALTAFDTLVRCRRRVSSLSIDATLSDSFASHCRMVSDSVPRGSSVIAYLTALLQQMPSFAVHLPVRGVSRTFFHSCGLVLSLAVVRLSQHSLSA